MIILFEPYFCVTCTKTRFYLDDIRCTLKSGSTAGWSSWRANPRKKRENDNRQGRQILKYEELGISDKLESNLALLHGAGKHSSPCLRTASMHKSYRISPWGESYRISPPAIFVWFPVCPLTKVIQSCILLKRTRLFYAWLVLFQTRHIKAIDF